MKNGREFFFLPKGARAYFPARMFGEPQTRFNHLGLTSDEATVFSGTAIQTFPVRKAIYTQSRNEIDGITHRVRKGKDTEQILKRAGHTKVSTRLILT